MCPDINDKIQRLCVAIEPGSYIRPHKHSEPGKWELFTLIRGSAAILTFDDSGRVTGKVIMKDSGPVYAAEIPPDTWHTLVALESGTLLLEIKPGPYSPLPEDDFAPWAPGEENESAAALFEQLFHSAKTGNKINEQMS